MPKLTYMQKLKNEIKDLKVENKKLKERNQKLYNYYHEYRKLKKSKNRPTKCLIVCSSDED